MRRYALAVVLTLFALTLVSRMFAFPAEKQHNWERGKVISQNLSSSPAGTYAAPMGTATVAVPIYRTSNVVVVETDDCRYELRERIEKSPIILPVNSSIQFYRDASWFIVLDSKGKKHKFGLLSMTAKGDKEHPVKDVPSITLSDVKTAETSTTTVSDIQRAGGFLDVCGLKASQSPKKSMDAVLKAPTGEVIDAIHKAMDEKVAEISLCIGYLTGLKEGWKEGHEHGVMAAHFPGGVPRGLAEAEAWKSMPTEELRAMGAEMKNDVPCLPEHLTVGQLNDAVIQYIRRQNPIMLIVPTARMVPAAMQDAFPCPAEGTK